MASTTIELLKNPLILATFQRLSISLLIGFTKPTSILRPILFLIILAWNLHVLPYYSDFIPRTAWVAYVAGETLTGCMRYAEQVLVQRWSFESYGFFQLKSRGKLQDVKASDGYASVQDSFGNRLRFGTWVCFSDRYIASSHQAAHTPPYSTSDPTYCPSRSLFIIRRVCLIILSYMILDAVAQGNQPDMNPILYGADKVPLLHRLWTGQATAEEIIIRIGTTLTFGFVAVWGIQMPLLACQVLVVALGLSRPELERPILGSIWDAYTLRGFWGSFWHQLLRRKLTTLSDYIMFEVLLLPRPVQTTKGRPELGYKASSLPRVLTKYTHLLVAFLISAGYHWVLDVATGLSWAESGAPQVFLLMAVGIMLEDTAQWIWFDVLNNDTNVEGKGLKKQRQHSRSQARSWKTMTIGYLWVVVWLSFVVPHLIYPTLRRNTGDEKDEILPFSAIRYFKGL